MRLYLIRHGEATDAKVPDRPLSARGRRDVDALAARLQRRQAAPRYIIHSGKLRARQTAERLAAVLHPRPDVAEQAGLAPQDDVRAFAARLDVSADTLIVGHLPFLAKLAGVLVEDNEEATVAAFPTAGGVCLEQTGAGGWRLCPASHTDAVTAHAHRTEAQ